MSKIYFDKLYLIGPIGDQYEGVDSNNNTASVDLMKDVKNYPLLINNQKN